MRYAQCGREPVLHARGTFIFYCKHRRKKLLTSPCVSTGPNAPSCSRTCSWKIRKGMWCGPPSRWAQERDKNTVSSCWTRRSIPVFFPPGALAHRGSAAARTLAGGVGRCWRGRAPGPATGQRRARGDRDQMRFSGLIDRFATLYLQSTLHHVAPLGLLRNPFQGPALLRTCSCMIQPRSLLTFSTSHDDM